jgi:hypothetical protein
MLLGDLAIVFLVVDDGGVRELQAELFVAGFELFEAVKHDYSSCVVAECRG